MVRHSLGIGGGPNRKKCFLFSLPLGGPGGSLPSIHTRKKGGLPRWCVSPHYGAAAGAQGCAESAPGGQRKAQGDLDVDINFIYIATCALSTHGRCQHRAVAPLGPSRCRIGARCHAGLAAAQARRTWGIEQRAARRLIRACRGSTRTSGLLALEHPLCRPPPGCRQPMNSHGEPAAAGAA